MIIPKEKPIFKGLNSYYLDILKLLDHYKWSNMAGCIHFSAKQAEAVVFFGSNDLYNAFFQDIQGEISGTEAIKRIKETTKENNFLVDIYKLPDNTVFLLSNMSKAKILYENLTTDLTDLDKLITKIKSEKITGYIEIKFQNSDNTALIFFLQGALIGSSCSWEDSTWIKNDAGLKVLQERTKKEGGVFRVNSIPLEEGLSREIALEDIQKDTVADFEAILDMLGEALSVAESLIDNKSKKRENFEMLLKQKFIDKADEYPFLDPFADEFAYSQGLVRFSGSASAAELATAVAGCLRELADEWNVQQSLEGELTQMREKYPASVSKYL